MGCSEDGSSRRRECLQYEDQGYEECSRREDQGYRRCSARELQCPDWMPDSACNAVNAVAHLVCVAWVWVSNLVCVAWTWISRRVCVSWSYVLEIGCIIWGVVVNWLDTLFGPGDRIDVHCHFFTGNTVAIYAVAGLFDIANRVDLLEEPENRTVNSQLIPPPCSDHSEEFDVVEALMKLHNFLDLVGARDSTEVYQELRRTYLFKYRVVPLMIDFAYCTDEEGLSAIIRKVDEIHTLLHIWLTKRTHVRTLEFLGELEAITRTLRLRLEEMRLLSGRPGVPLFVDFSGQARQLMAVRAQYRNRIFPFLSVDPRRPGILELVKEYVGPKKPFLGIKLYAPVGFSPTSPVLFGTDREDDCLYRYCSENAIPITAHCSPGGFASFANKVTVHGHIQVNEGVEIEIEGMQGPVGSDGVCEINGRVLFSTSVEQHGLEAMVAERSRTLNHPNIWRRVLEKYPELYLNLAHFGGQADMCLYAGDSHDSGHGYIPWSSYIVELMEEYPNVYTDVACYNDSDAVGLFKKQIYDAMLSRNVKRKVMYGSDYNVLMLSESSVSDYLHDFKRIFGKEFEKISKDNPNRFLFVRD